HYLSALRKPFWSWFIGTLLNRVCRRVWPFVKHNLWVAAMAHNKRTYHLLNFMPKLDDAYDLVIAHNLGALYPAWIVAGEKEIPFAFDVEDYHPGEASAMGSKNEVKRREQLMSWIIPNAIYYSYASPMIGEYTG